MKIADIKPYIDVNTLSQEEKAENYSLMIEWFMEQKKESALDPEKSKMFAGYLKLACAMQECVDPIGYTPSMLLERMMNLVGKDINATILTQELSAWNNLFAVERAMNQVIEENPKLKGRNVFDDGMETVAYAVQQYIYKEKGYEVPDHETLVASIKDMLVENKVLYRSKGMIEVKERALEKFSLPLIKREPLDILPNNVIQLEPEATKKIVIQELPPVTLLKKEPEEKKPEVMEEVLIEELLPVHTHEPIALKADIKKNTQPNLDKIVTDVVNSITASNPKKFKGRTLSDAKKERIVSAITEVFSGKDITLLGDAALGDLIKRDLNRLKIIKTPILKWRPLSIREDNLEGLTFCLKVSLDLAIEDIKKPKHAEVLPENPLPVKQEQEAAAYKDNKPLLMKKTDSIKEIYAQFCQTTIELDDEDTPRNTRTNKEKIQELIRVNTLANSNMIKTRPGSYMAKIRAEIGGNIANEPVGYTSKISREFQESAIYI